METFKSFLPRPSTVLKWTATSPTNAKQPSSTAGSSAGDTAYLPEGSRGDSKVNQLLSQWKKLDENLSSFERLESMRKLVAQGDMTSGAYDMLHDLAVSRATGKTRKPSALGVTALESPIMAGYLHLRVGKSWKKRYVLLFTERLEYHGSKQESESNRRLGATAPSLLALTEKFFVSDSASRRLVNEREKGFMVSDFVTTHYFSADSKDLMQYWMHIIAKTIRKIQEAKAFFDKRPKIIGNIPKSAEALEKEYQERLSSYNASRGSKTLKPELSVTSGDRAKSIKSPAIRDLIDSDAAVERKSIRLRLEAAELESKMMEHANRQMEFEKEATKAEEVAVQIQQELEASGSTESASSKDVEEKKARLEELEARRIEFEEHALLEARMVIEYEELVEEKNIDAAKALAEEEIAVEIKRRSVAVLPLNTPPDQIEKILEDKLMNPDSAEQLELQALAVEAVARRAIEEQDDKVKEAEVAFLFAKEKHHEAEHAQGIEDVEKKVQADEEAQRAAERAALERDQAIKKAELLQRMIADSRSALERSKKKTEARMAAKTMANATMPKTPAASAIQLEEPHIQKQIERLAAIINREGEVKQQDGFKELPFGKICKLYEAEIAEVVETSAYVRSNDDAGSFTAAFDIVGLLVRAKRQHVLDYEGGNLFRGKDDSVVIRATAGT